MSESTMTRTGMMIGPSPANAGRKTKKPAPKKQKKTIEQLIAEGRKR